MAARCAIVATGARSGSRRGEILLASGGMALSPKRLLAGAALCAGAFLVLLALAYGWGQARAVDGAALQGFLGLYDTMFGTIARTIVHLGDPLEVALITIGLAVFSIARGQPRRAAYALALIGATSLGGQLLKAVLAYPRPDVTGEIIIRPEAFPSGHATASMSLAVALVVVMPTRLRPAAAAVGVLLALGVSFSMLIVGGHFASDIVAGFLLATGTGLALLAGLRVLDQRFPQRQGRGEATAAIRRALDAVAGVGLTTVLATTAVLLLLGSVAFIVLRAGDILAYAQEHTAFALVSLSIVLAALVLLGGLATLTSRRN